MAFQNQPTSYQGLFRYKKQVAVRDMKEKSLCKNLRLKTLLVCP